VPPSSQIEAFPTSNIELVLFLSLFVIQSITNLLPKLDVFKGEFLPLPPLISGSAIVTHLVLGDMVNTMLH
jgi:hypothetical protein